MEQSGRLQGYRKVAGCRMDIKFDGKRVLVTGTGRGIGRTTCLKLLECGASVIALSRPEEDMSELKAKQSGRLQGYRKVAGCRMDIKFDGKRVLVTGAGRGIGRTICLKLLECGASVIALSRPEEDMSELKAKQSGRLQGYRKVAGCRMDIKFDGKRVLVTGAGRGIGRTICLKLLECGASVIALSRPEEDMSELKAKAPDRVDLIHVDLADWDTTKTVVEATGRIDLLINNAGILIVKSFLDCTKEDIDMTFDIDFKAVFNISQIVARNMIARGNGGAIVNISSIGSRIVVPDCATYCAAKAAVDSLTRSMATELGPHNIRTNAIQPTLVMTEISKPYWSNEELSAGAKSRIPLGRFAKEEDVAETALYLLSDKATMLNGATVPVDGGYLCN